MAKRNTTGLPKRKKKTSAAEEAAETDSSLLSNILGQQYANRQQRESHIQRLVIIGVGVLVVLLAVLILGGILWESVLVPQRTVATVNGESINISEFQERVRLERLVINQRFYNDIPFLQNLGLIQDPNQILQQEPYSTYWGEITGGPELLGSRVLDDMIDEVIVRQQAEEMGVTFDQESVDENVENFFNLITVTEEPAITEEATEEAEPTSTATPFVSPTPSPLPTNTATPTPLPAVTEEVSTGATEEALDITPTVTPRPTNTPSPTPSNEERQAEFEEALDRFYVDASSVNLSEETVRSYFEYDALVQALREEVTADIDEMAPFVNSRHILVETEEQAQQVLAALEEGESFADLARAVSTDTGSGSRGGELGWSPASGFVPPFRDAVIEAEIGEVVGPVESDFGFHIIQVRAREERELSETQLQQAKDSEFAAWLEGVVEDESNNIERRDNWPAYVPTGPTFNPNRVLGDEATGT